MGGQASSDYVPVDLKAFGNFKRHLENSSFISFHPCRNALWAMKNAKDRHHALNDPIFGGCTALTALAQQGRLPNEVIDLFEAAGADLNAVDKNGKTLLFALMSNEWVSLTISYVLKKRIITKSLDYQCTAPCSLQKGLQSYPPPPSTTIAPGSTALMVVAARGMHQICDKLIKAGASLHILNSENDSPLTLALRYYHNETTPNRGRHMPVELDYALTVQNLVLAIHASGSSKPLNNVGPEGSAIAIAAKKRLLPIVELLAQAGANLSTLPVLKMNQDADIYEAVNAGMLKFCAPEEDLKPLLLEAIKIPALATLCFGYYHHVWTLPELKPKEEKNDS